MRNDSMDALRQGNGSMPRRAAFPGFDNGTMNSWLFLASGAIVCIFALASLYSTAQFTYGGRSAAYRIVLRQVLYIVIGLALSSTSGILEKKAGRIVIGILQILFSALCAVSMFERFYFITTDTFRLALNTVWVLYLSAYFSKREATQVSGSIIIPSAFAVLISVCLASRSGISSALFFVALTLVFFTTNARSPVKVLLATILVIVPVCMVFLSDGKAITAVSGFVSDNGRAYRSVWSRSGFLGSGFGKNNSLSFQGTEAAYAWSPSQGQDASLGFASSRAVQAAHLEDALVSMPNERVSLSDSGINDREAMIKENAFLVFVARTGFIGVSLFFIFYGMLVYAALRSANHLKAENSFASLVGIGMVFILFMRFLANVLHCMGFVADFGIGMPFFSFSASTVLLSFQCAMIYRFAKAARKGAASSWDASSTGSLQNYDYGDF